MIRVRDILVWQVILNTTRVIIRKPYQMRTRRQLLLIGGIMGLPPTFYWLLLMLVTHSSFHPTGWSALAPMFLVFYSIIIQLVAVAIFHAVQWSHVEKILDLALSAALTGVMVGSIAILELVALDGFRLRRALADMLTMLGLVIGSGVAYALVTLLLWSIAKWHNYHCGVRVVVQEATCCATCGYDLSGKQSMVCPSCGTAFTLEGLRTSDELSKLANERKEES